MKAALYTRVSTEEQAEYGFSLDAQKRRLYEYCNSNNIEIYNIYTDEGISGHSITKRVALQKLLKDAKAKLFDLVVVYKTDRLSRNLLDLLTIKKELDVYDIELRMSDESIDTTDDTGMTMFSIMGAFAELERKKITERMMTGKRQLIRSTKTKLKQGIIPYGYIYDDINKSYVVNDLYREQIIQIYEKYAHGESYSAILRWMRDNNINFGNTNKKVWHISDTIRIIKNPIYKGYAGISYSGMYRYSRAIKNEPILFKATNVEPIVSEELWDKCNSIASVLQKSFVKKRPKEMFIFSSVLYCADCGRKMRAHQSTYRVTREKTLITYYYYQCRGTTDSDASVEELKKNYWCVGIAKVESYFKNHIKQMIKVAGTSPSKQLVIDEKALLKRKDAISNEITSKLKQKETLLEKLVSETISDDDYKSMSNKLLTDIKSLQNELSGVNEQILGMEDKLTYTSNLKDKLKVLGNLIKMWDKISDNDKKFIIDSSISRINIFRDKVFEIEYK